MPTIIVLPIAYTPVKVWLNTPIGNTMLCEPIETSAGAYWFVTLNCIVTLPTFVPVQTDVMLVIVTVAGAGGGSVWLPIKVFGQLAACASTVIVP